jgi:GntR family transcriptional repressor for pyruvate dehydrogenase complex
VINSGRAPLKASEQLARRIRTDMASGALPVGTMLPPEARMMADLGVGRPTLREALRLLEAESLVRVRRGAHGGVEVTSPTTEPSAQALSMVLTYLGAPLGEILSIRASLEIEAFTSMLAQRSVRAVVTAVTAVVEASADLGPADTARGLVADDDFRQAALDSAKTPARVLIAGLLGDMTRAQRGENVARLTGPAARRYVASVQAAHGGILSALVADDRSRALESWRALCTDTAAVAGPKNRRVALMPPCG